MRHDLRCTNFITAILENLESPELFVWFHRRLTIVKRERLASERPDLIIQPMDFPFTTVDQAFMDQEFMRALRIILKSKCKHYVMHNVSRITWAFEQLTFIHPVGLLDDSAPEFRHKLDALCTS